MTEHATTTASTQIAAHLAHAFMLPVVRQVDADVLELVVVGHRYTCPRRRLSCIAFRARAQLREQTVVAIWRTGVR